MTRVYHAEKLELGQLVELDEFASHHLSKVMRNKVGDQVNVFNPKGEFVGQIETITKKSVTLQLKEKINVVTESPLRTTLIQAVTRRERMDYSIQKATELGINLIQPVISERCVVKLDEKRSQQRLKHWQGIARHAAEQSGRLSIPDIKPITSFTEAITMREDDELKLIFALQASQPLANLTQADVKSVSYAIGPVGGFSDKEVKMALTQNFHSIKFGPRVLRAETATAAMLTAVQMRWGDLK